MKLKDIKAFVFVAALPYLLGGLLVLGGLHETAKIVQPGRNKAVAEQMASLSSVLNADIKLANDKAIELQKVIIDQIAAHQKAEDLHDKKDVGVAGLIIGAKTLLENDPAQTDAEIAAQALLNDAYNANGQKLTPEQNAIWVKIAAGIIAKNAKERADATAQIEKWKTDANNTHIELEIAKKDFKAKDEQAKDLSGQLTVVTGRDKKTSEKLNEVVQENKNWAENALSAWQKIKALGGLSVILAIGAICILIKMFGFKAVAKDATALVGHTVTVAKDLVAKGVTDVKEASAIIEKEHSDWWGEAVKDKANFNAIKTDLRQ